MRPGAIWCRADFFCALFVIPRTPKTNRRGDTISEGVTTPNIAKRDQKPGDGPSDILLMLNDWCKQAMRSQFEPMKKVAKTLRGHRELILDYFRVKKQLSSGAAERLNNKAKATMRKSYGLRTFRIAEIVLYHTFRKLPEPENTHSFC
jgi:hypothetical protein